MFFEKIKCKFRIIVNSQGTHTVHKKKKKNNINIIHPASAPCVSTYITYNMPYRYCSYGINLLHKPQRLHHNLQCSLIIVHLHARTHIQMEKIDLGSCGEAPS